MACRPGAPVFPARACPDSPGRATLTAPCTPAWGSFTMMTSVRVTLVLGGTAIYLGLAILGWGGWTAFVAHPARVALAVVLAVLAGVALCANGNLSRALREDRGDRWVIGALTLLGLLAAYLPAYTDRKAL